MKQMRWHETISLGLVVTYFCMIFMPIPNLAQTFDTTPPTICHQPVKLGKVGKPLSIIANIGDKSGVRASILKINYQSENMEVEMIPVAKEQSLPIKIKIKSEQKTVLSGPGQTYKKIGELVLDELVDVNLVRDNYYRIHSQSGLNGYIENNGCETIESGQEFKAIIPSIATKNNSISYQIFAMDTFGNEAQTEIIDVRLIDEQQLSNLQAKTGLSNKELSDSGKMTKKRSKPIYARSWFWIATGATLGIGGGIYYYLSIQEPEKTKDATVQVIMGW